MISANPIPQPNGRYVLFFKGPSFISPVEVRSIQEGTRVVYFKTRNYMVDKTFKWLEQRKYAIGLSNDCDRHEKLSLIERMSASLNDRRHVSLRLLCNYITNVEDKIRFVAPAASSSHYKHYKQVISPILAFATGQDLLELQRLAPTQKITKAS